jgi:thiamine-phosphate pyrophosphorylase
MAADRFILCLITEPEAVADEAAKIAFALDAGIDWVHLRKPAWSASQQRELINRLEPRHRLRLRLHDCFELLDDYELGGVQLNGRHPQAPASARSVARSCHTVEELQSAQGLAYATLSPIFDSISKQGYRSPFRLEELRLPPHTVALGGVTPDSFALLKRIGFEGAAMLGGIGWREPLDAFKQIVTNVINQR